MNGAQDLGGAMGFGPVRAEANEPVFHAPWEARVLAVTLASGGLGEWTIDEGLSWNEQYMLQAFLMHNTDYEVRLAMGMLLTERASLMLELLPDHPGGVGVWIEKLRA